MARLTAFPSTLRGQVKVPGDKSISHRALILAAMAEGETRVEGLLESEDVLRTAAAVRQLGAGVTRERARWRVSGGTWRSPLAPIDCGNSGTTARLLMGAVAGRPVTATFTGDASLRQRPMARIVDPLRLMGARLDGGDRLPLTVTGGRLGPIRYRSPAASAQVKSALLLAGLGSDAEVELIEPAPSRDHTEIMLRRFGCDVESERGVVRLGRQRRLRSTDIQVPGDPSSAAFPLLGALVSRGSITIEDVLANPLRSGFLSTLKEMGSALSILSQKALNGEEVATIAAEGAPLRGVAVPAERVPAMIDEYPALAVAAAFAEGETVMQGLAELRVKESDRLDAMAAGLSACGVAVRTEGDTLTVRGGRVPGGAVVDSRGDHRIAMAFLTLGLGAEAPVTVDGTEMIATSFPGFVEAMRGLGARIEAA